MNTKYTIVQDVLSQDKKGTLSASEVVLAYPDTLVNAKTRLLKWQNILEIDNIRLRQATMNDYPKTKKQKRKEKMCSRR
jgi:hypothetical protein